MRIEYSLDEKLTGWSYRICDLTNADFVRSYITSDAYPTEGYPLRRLKALQYMRDRGLTREVWRVLAQCRRDYTAATKRYRAARLEVDRAARTGANTNAAWLRIREAKQAQLDAVGTAGRAYNEMFFSDDWRAEHETA